MSYTWSNSVLSCNCLMNSVKVSVACLVYDKNDRILLVKERQVIGVVYNQPAGHLQPGETLIGGAVREVKERTGLTVEIDSLLGVYEHYFEETGSHVIRFCFLAKAPKDVDVTVDFHKTEIVSAEFHDKSELKSMRDKYRNPLVAICIDDFYRGIRFKLDMIKFV